MKLCSVIARLKLLSPTSLRSSSDPLSRSYMNSAYHLYYAPIYPYIYVRLRENLFLFRHLFVTLDFRVYARTGVTTRGLRVSVASFERKQVLAKLAFLELKDNNYYLSLSSCLVILGRQEKDFLNDTYFCFALKVSDDYCFLNNCIVDGGVDIVERSSNIPASSCILALPVATPLPYFKKLLTSVKTPLKVVVNFDNIDAFFSISTNIPHTYVTLVKIKVIKAGCKVKGTRASTTCRAGDSIYGSNNTAGLTNVSIALNLLPVDPVLRQPRVPKAVLTPVNFLLLERFSTSCEEQLKALDLVENGGYLGRKVVLCVVLDRLLPHGQIFMSHHMTMVSVVAPVVNGPATCSMVAISSHDGSGGGSRSFWARDLSKAAALRVYSSLGEALSAAKNTFPTCQAFSSNRLCYSFVLNKSLTCFIRSLSSIHSSGCGREATLDATVASVWFVLPPPPPPPSPQSRLNTLPQPPSTCPDWKLEPPPCQQTVVVGIAFLLSLSQPRSKRTFVVFSTVEDLVHSSVLGEVSKRYPDNIWKPNPRTNAGLQGPKRDNSYRIWHFYSCVSCLRQRPSKQQPRGGPVFVLDPNTLGVRTLPTSHAFDDDSWASRVLQELLSGLGAFDWEVVMVLPCPSYSYVGQASLPEGRRDLEELIANAA
nr:hypothetical protein HmN_000906700 [Hymenolepis microstoma]